jgi:hypothetical protein
MHNLFHALNHTHTCAQLAKGDLVLMRQPGAACCEKGHYSPWVSGLVLSPLSHEHCMLASVKGGTSISLKVTLFSSCRNNDNKKNSSLQSIF